MDIIASRKLDLKHVDGTLSDVLVKLERPKQADQGEFRCNFWIEGLAGDWPKFAVGEDSMQALILALNIIEAHLKNSDAARAGRLTWLGMAELGFGA